MWPELLPGEQATQPVQLTSGLPSTLPTEVQTAPPTISQPTFDWLVAHQDKIGARIPADIYNQYIGQGIIEELHKLGHIKVVQDYPWLKESARRFLTK